jgi:cell division protein FtsN
VEAESPEEMKDAISELMVENNEPKWYESESVAQVVAEADQNIPEPKIEVTKSEPTSEPIPPPAPKKKTTKSKTRGKSIPYDKERFTIQIASKKFLDDAKKVAANLIDAGYDAYIQKAVFKETNEIWYRVRVGSYDKRDTAVAVAKSLSSTRPEPAWVDYVRYEN